MVVFANSQRCFDENSISRSKGRMTNGKIRSLSKKSIESVSQYFFSSWKKVLVGEKGRLEGTIKPGYHARGERERGEGGGFWRPAHARTSPVKNSKKRGTMEKRGFKILFCKPWPVAAGGRTSFYYPSHWAFERLRHRRATIDFPAQIEKRSNCFDYDVRLSLLSSLCVVHSIKHVILFSPPPAKKEMCSTLQTAETTISYSAGEGEIKT